ncbi:hypothetical protein EGR_11009 [Echinococcus granulosus]|uniref:Uncharacterized protein n=1 Tax=Echinococcus granulosus TaxID=6210 RepID=W6TZI4_ECHGR|nr:hypothetical protein EGR_11009 [Echinococcus granulosus]EUB54133.1 hypothetical protein EGR_11009 [Echinococcus granulosus]
MSNITRFLAVIIANALVTMLLCLPFAGVPISDRCEYQSLKNILSSICVKGSFMILLFIHRSSIFGSAKFGCSIHAKCYIEKFSNSAPCPLYPRRINVDLALFQEETLASFFQPFTPKTIFLHHTCGMCSISFV